LTITARVVPGGDFQVLQGKCEVALGREPRLRVAPGDFGKESIGGGEQMHLLTKTVEYLAQDQFGARVDVDEILRHTETIAEE
jgi:hypothetical protein